ncbi:MAG: hypothetical protein GY829_11570 [Gammaproteobacteria bacterium]|nr:hypothetical protein [Gammaproteobacteria bacterium]
MTEPPNLWTPLMQLAEELAGVDLLETGTLDPFFLLAKKKNAYQIPVNFSNTEQLKFTSVKIAAILQSKTCDHYAFATRIQFKAQAGEKEVMKQQVLILNAEQTNDGFSCQAKLYNLKLNQKIGKPQLDVQQVINDYDGQFSNLFDAPKVPLDLVKELTGNIEQYLVSLG